MLLAQIPSTKHILYSTMAIQSYNNCHFSVVYAQDHFRELHWFAFLVHHLINFFFMQDCPNLAMINYRDSMITANKAILVLALFNCCCMSRKYSYSTELDFRCELIKCLKCSEESNQVIVMRDNVFSRFHPLDINSSHISLFAGLRAIQLNK